jgi:hypothetical protein
MNNEKETITITLPRRLVDKLREIDRIVDNGDLGQTLAESCGWCLENLTDPKSEEIIDFIEDKRWRSRSECEKATAVIAAELKNWPIEIEKGADGWRVRVFSSARWHSLWKYCQAEGLDYDEAHESSTTARWAV